MAVSEFSLLRQLVKTHVMKYRLPFHEILGLSSVISAYDRGQGTVALFNIKQDTESLPRM